MRDQLVSERHAFVQYREEAAAALDREQASNQTLRDSCSKWRSRTHYRKAQLAATRGDSGDDDRSDDDDDDDDSDPAPVRRRQLGPTAGAYPRPLFGLT